MRCALAIGGASPARAAIGEYLGKPVAAVVFVIEGRDTTDPSLSDVIETRVGMPLSMADVRETSCTSISLGRFDDVRVDATLNGAGVSVRYDSSARSTRSPTSGSTGSPRLRVQTKIACDAPLPNEAVRRCVSGALPNWRSPSRMP